MTDNITVTPGSLGVHEATVRGDNAEQYSVQALHVTVRGMLYRGGTPVREIVWGGPPDVPA